ncbi:hypothetical protein HQ393_04580 [Chitinibacter bivalviorum]|uniref:Uncharacterized protein n=1 Tax=Chitinibacter bivalviorum TaxID=2739434 RepID=A0A7H9BG65_9NEIS|nr:hypothetical protein [Chitinibacter bivalviorum]QLG87587.1 hypothetical protein HQ393_04580 [Chitinibacter bivalviorum]
MLKQLNEALNALKNSGVLEAKAKAAAFADVAVETIDHLHKALDTAQQLAVDSVNELVIVAARLERLERLSGLHVEQYEEAPAVANHEIQGQ